MKPVFSNTAACLQMLDMNPNLAQVDTNQMDTPSTARGEDRRNPTLATTIEEIKRTLSYTQHQDTYRHGSMEQSQPSASSVRKTKTKGHQQMERFIILTEFDSINIPGLLFWQFLSAATFLKSGEHTNGRLGQELYVRFWRGWLTLIQAQ